MTNEEAIDYFERSYASGDTDDERQHNEALNKAIKALEQQPKTGHWVKVTNGRGGHECDACHDYAPSFQNGNEYLSAFCPNCGADMRGDKNDK